MSDAPPPRLGLTSPQQAAVAVLTGAVVTFVALQLTDLAGGLPPRVPWSVPALLGVLALATLIWSRVMSSRLDEHKVTSQEGLVAVATAKSSVLSGCLLAGASACYALLAVPLLPAPHPAHRMWVGVVTALAAAALAGCGYALERACVVDGDDDDDTDGTRAPTST